MENTTVNQFRDNPKSYTAHRETLWVLRNADLMRQIAESMETYKAGTGYTPTQEQMNEILDDRSEFPKFP